MDFKDFSQIPVLGIIRGITEDSLEGTFQAAVKAGFCAIEITMNTPDASPLITESVKHFKKHISIGAGTVTNMQELDDALSSGATFIVTPVFNSEISRYCNDNGVPIIPGALTPSEIHRAWDAGAAMIKVFPAQVFGPSYFSSIKGPFNDIKLMAVGGVTLENIADYFSNGAAGIATGNKVFKKEWMDTGNYDAIYEAGKAFVDKVRSLF